MCIMTAVMSRLALARYVPSLALFAALLVAWQAAGPLFGIREYLLPGPLAVARAALNFSIPWPTHVWITTLEIVGGFALAGAAGVLLGIAVAWSPVTARALVPFLVFVNTLPKVAVAPLFLLWLGYGIVPYVLSALKITATAAVVGAVVGEFVASQAGLGMVIVNAQTNLNTPVAFAALVWISIVGLALYGAVGLAARRWAPWAEI